MTIRLVIGADDGRRAICMGKDEGHDSGPSMKRGVVDDDDETQHGPVCMWGNKYELIAIRHRSFLHLTWFLRRPK